MSEHGGLPAAQLHILNPEGATLKTYPLHPKTLSLGRLNSNGITLESSKVSKIHAAIEPRKRGYELVDQGSRNGTFVNNIAITRRFLFHGDEVQIGDMTLRFHCESLLPTSLEWVKDDDHHGTQLIAKTPVRPMSGPSDLDPENSIANLRLANQRLQLTLDAVRELIELNDVDHLFERILDFTFELLEADEGAVLLLNDDQSITMRSCRFSVPLAPKSELCVSETIIQAALKDKAAILAADIQSDVRFRDSQSLNITGAKSVMCVPIQVEDTLHGFIYLVNRAKISAFSESDLSLFTAIGHGGGIALHQTLLTQKWAQENQLRQSLGRFLSPVLVDQVLAQRVDLDRGGDELRASILFADIRDFTALTETTEAKEVVKLLNEYFGRMVEIVFELDGILDKFIGDAFMAVWGPPKSQAHDATRALMAAKAVFQELEILNQERLARGEHAIEVGIGIATGNCVAGAIGAMRRMEYTVIGDAVNLASRLSGVAKAGEIVCNAETLSGIDPVLQVASSESIQVKGKAQPVEIKRLLWRTES